MTNIIYELTTELHSFFPIPDDASLEYSRLRGALEELVNNRVSSLPHINKIVPHRLRSVMLDNHRNHVNFMANVFTFNQPDMLLQTIPWVYRTYHDHGFSYDYFPEHLTAWQNAVTELLMPTAAAAINPVYRWMVDHHNQFVTASLSADSGTDTTTDLGWSSVKERFFNGLIRGRSQECLAVSSEIRSVDQLMPFMQNVVQPCMYEIGELWERGEITVALEHQASSIVGRVMSSLYANFARPHPSKGRAVVSSATNEYHELGAWIVSDMLELDGWEVRYLGANTPVSDLLTMMVRFKPHLLALSITMPFNVEHAHSIISAMRQEPKIAQTTVMVGGNAMNSAPGLWKAIGAHGYALDAEGAVFFAREKWERMTAAERL